MNRLQRYLLLVVLGIAGTTQALGANLKVPLRKLTDARELVLRCITDQQSIQIPLPERWSVRRAGLRLRYTVSNNLARDSSQLVIKLNDIVVAQTRLNPQSPDAVIDVPIPTDLMQPGYNRLSFESVQHSVGTTRQQCESPCSPDMWTNIDLKESFLQIDYDLEPVPLDLSKLSGFVFDPRLTPEGSVHLVTEDLSEPAVNAAAVVASGIRVASIIAR